VGDSVNIETDILARHVARMAEFTDAPVRHERTES
jgi:riboflavin synthase